MESSSLSVKLPWINKSYKTITLSWINKEPDEEKRKSKIWAQHMPIKFEWINQSNQTRWHNELEAAD